MKTRPIHENLDTSFVNLSALLRYLQRRQFAGRVRVELSGYEADIVLLEGNKLQVHEHDRIAGRSGEGEEALQRLLIRAREPGGTINVYQMTGEAAKNEPAAGKPKPVALEAEQNPNGFPKAASNGNSNGHQTPQTLAAAEANPPSKSAARLPNFPFDLTNEVEAKARLAQQISPHDWQTLLQLIGELLGTIDKTLAGANLNFSAALLKVRAEIALDYPFLNPASGVFEYAHGKVTMHERTSAKLIVGSINEALRRILEKLGASAKFSQIYRVVVQKILALIQQRKPLYEKFFITPQLEKILGA
ncbi:MAG TPA: hypothetical protein VF599_11530 [Pyrinomonadaceae bacterium]